MAAKTAKEWAHQLLQHEKTRRECYGLLSVELTRSDVEELAALLVRLDRQVEAAKALIMPSSVVTVPYILTS